MKKIDESGEKRRWTEGRWLVRWRMAVVEGEGGKSVGEGQGWSDKA